MRRGAVKTRALEHHIGASTAAAHACGQTRSDWHTGESQADALMEKSTRTMVYWLITPTPWHT